MPLRGDPPGPERLAVDDEPLHGGLLRRIAGEEGLAPSGAEHLGAGRRAGMAVLAVATSYPAARLARVADRVVPALEGPGPADLEAVPAAAQSGGGVTAGK